MRELRNDVKRSLTYEEHFALIEMCRALEKGFKRSVYKVTVTANDYNATQPFGILVGFDNQDNKVNEETEDAARDY